MQCYFYFYFFKKRATLEVEFYQCGRGTSQSNFSSCFPFRSVEAEAVAGRRAVVVGVCGGGVVGHGSGAWLELAAHNEFIIPVYMPVGREGARRSAACLINRFQMDSQSDTYGFEFDLLCFRYIRTSSNNKSAVTLIKALGFSFILNLFFYIKAPVFFFSISSHFSLP